MSMNGTILGDEIKAAIGAIGDKTDISAIWQAIGNAIVDHITTNAEATGTGDYIATRLEDSVPAAVTANGSPTTNVTIAAGGIS